MTTSGQNQSESRGEERLPRRDWILLPLIALVVVGFLSGSLEFIARRMLIQNNKAPEDCMIFNDRATGPRGIPNCVCLEKLGESSGLVDYRFDSNGFRNDTNLRPKAPGVFRITMIGTSVAAGFRVSQEQTFATLLPAELSRRTGRTVELYNEGMPWRSPRMIARYFDRDVLGTQPDMILWIVVPMDINRSDWDIGDANPAKALLNDSSLRGYAKKIAFRLMTPRLLEMLLYRSPSLYVRSSLLKHQEDTRYLKRIPSAELLRNLHEFDQGAAEIQREASKAGIPVVVALVPDRTQVSMIATGGEWPSDLDPYELSAELRPIVARHGWAYIDTPPYYRTVPNPQLGFFSVDGHPNAEGHSVIARILASALTSGIVPALDTASKQEALSETRR